MILGTKTRYAVMAMVELAGRPQDKAVSLADLAEAQEITVPYLEQIFSKLRQAELVNSVRGPGGGYLLAKAANDIHISDIVEAVDESLKMTRCESHAETGCMSTKARCLTHDLWDGLGRQIHGYLHSITLSDVINKRGIKGELAQFMPTSHHS